jgi:hypothetical protein
MQSIEYNLSSEADSFSEDQEIFRILWNSVDKNQLLDLSPSQLNPFHTPTHYFFKIHLIAIFLYKIRSRKEFSLQI